MDLTLFFYIIVLLILFIFLLDIGSISALRQFVLVTPPQDPKALTRSWCLWELYNALYYECHIHFHTSGKLYGDFQNMMMTKKTFKTLIKAFGANINCNDAAATNPAHAAMLNMCLNEEGIDKVDHLISQCTRSWLATKGDEMVDRLLRSISAGDEGKKDKKQALDACVLVAGLWKDLDKLDKAEPSYRHVLELREDLLGKDNPRTIKAMQNLASLLQALNLRSTAQTGWNSLAGSLNRGLKGLKGKSNNAPSRANYLVESELLFRRALVKQEQVLGLTAPETLQSINNFAVFCQKNQKLREAELLYRRALKGFEQAYGKGHSHTLQAGHNLASLLQEQGETLQAVEMYRNVYEGRVSALGGEDPRTLQTLSRLGTVCQLLGNISEAESIFQQLVTMHNDVQGGDAAETFHAMSMLASCMIDAQNTAEAEPLLRSVYEGRKLKFGETDIETLQAASDLANFCYTKGNMTEAETLHNLVLAGRKEQLGKRHMDTLKTVTKLAAVYFARNDLAEAQKLYMQAYEGYKRNLGLSHSCTMLCVDMLARLLLKQKKFDQALPFYDTAFKHYSSTLGPSHPDTLNMMGCCGVCMQSLDRVQEGNNLLQKCIEEMNNVLVGLNETSPIIASITKRISRFQKTLEQGRLKTINGSSTSTTMPVSFDEASKTDNFVETKSEMGDPRKAAWVDRTSGSGSGSSGSQNLDRHLRPTGLGVMFANRLDNFSTPSPPPRGRTPRSGVVGRRGPPRGVPSGRVSVMHRPPRGAIPRGRPRPPPTPPPTSISQRSQSPSLKNRQISNV